MRSSSLTFNTIALELVPPNVDRGAEQAIEEAHKVLQLAAKSGIEGRIGHVMMPGLIAEEDDRPVEMKPKLDVLDFWSIIKPELPGVSGLCSQVTAFMDEPSLRQRLGALVGAGIEGIVFVGVPRTMADGEGSGVAPTDALSIYQQLVANRGVILIPTREGEVGRLNFKCDQRATFAQTQLLYSDAIVGFLTDFAKQTDHRPEILLSFGFVPKVEEKVGFINWLIQDPGNAAVADAETLTPANGIAVAAANAALDELGQPGKYQALFARCERASGLRSVRRKRIAATMMSTHTKTARLSAAQVKINQSCASATACVLLTAGQDGPCTRGAYPVS